MWAADHMQYSPFYSHRLEHNINIIYCALCWFGFREKQKGKNHLTFLTSPRCGSFILSWFFCLFFRRSSTLTCRVKPSARFILLTWQEGKLCYLTCFERRMLFFYQSQPVKAFKGSSPWHLCSCFILLLLQLKNITMFRIVIFHCLQ